MSFDIALVGRVALGALLGYVVGWEREIRGSTAGDRTFALVAMGAAAFTVVGVDSFPATAEKILAGVVTGIGFLGAGVIVKGEGSQVLGITTAASLWATAALGILAGAGEPLVAVSVAMLILLVLESGNLPIIRRLDAGQRKSRLEGRPATADADETSDES